MLNLKKLIFLVCAIIFISAISSNSAELPADPNNAALLYYQALLLCPEPDAVTKDLIIDVREEQIFEMLRGVVPKDYNNLDEKIRKLEEKLNNEELIREMEEKQKEWSKHRNAEILTSKMLQDYAELTHYVSEKSRYKDLKARQEGMRGSTPNEKIRKYLGDCRQSIELAQAASEISECDWGLRYSQGLACPMPKLTGLRQFSFLLRADALLLAADGDYRAALERCLMMRRFARHVGDDAVIIYLVAKALDNNALKCIRFLLGNMSPDVETLTWLKNQLSTEKKTELSYERPLKNDFGMALKSLHEKFSDTVQKQDEENPGKNTFNFTGEDFITRGKRLYSNFLSSSFEVMDSNMPYSDKYVELQRLADKLRKDVGMDPGAFGLIMVCEDNLHSIYKIKVDSEAYSNALEAAVEVYLLKTETGELPQVLPDGLPKDPYTGENFVYEITDDGFALRCQGKEYLERKNQFLEFKVKR